MRTMSRRSALVIPPLALVASQLAAVKPASAAARPLSAQGRSSRTTTLSVRGADLSFTPQLEAVGVRFSDRGKVRPVERILADHGATYVRLRVWTAPPAGYSDEASALAMARRAKRAGLKVLLDLHYSDFWADPAHQTTPAAWQGQDLPTLAATVRGYTRAIVAKFARHGAAVDMIQIGNEVTAGMLWPLGELYPAGTAALGGVHHPAEGRHRRCPGRQPRPAPARRDGPHRPRWGQRRLGVVLRPHRGRGR